MIFYTRKRPKWLCVVFSSQTRKTSTLMAPSQSNGVQALWHYTFPNYLRIMIISCFGSRHNVTNVITSVSYVSKGSLEHDDKDVKWTVIGLQNWALPKRAIVGSGKNEVIMRDILWQPKSVNRKKQTSVKPEVKETYPIRKRCITISADSFSYVCMYVVCVCVYVYLYIR